MFTSKMYAVMQIHGYFLLYVSPQSYCNYCLYMTHTLQFFYRYAGTLGLLCNHPMACYKFSNTKILCVISQLQRERLKMLTSPAPSIPPLLLSLAFLNVGDWISVANKTKLAHYF